jgi:lysozyme family protein
MADFAAAIKVILGHEGGLADDPADRGGITNFGLTIPWLNGHANAQACTGHPLPWTPEDVRLLTKAVASAIYHECLWIPNRYGDVMDNLVATKVFDMAVNFGETMGERLAQRACNACGWKPALFPDGNIGDKSIEAFNGTERIKLLHAMCEQQEARYRWDVQHDPTQERFLHTWLERAEWPF